MKEKQSQNISRVFLFPVKYQVTFVRSYIFVNELSNSLWYREMTVHFHIQYTYFNKVTKIVTIEYRTREFVRYIVGPWKSKFEYTILMLNEIRFSLCVLYDTKVALW